MGLYGLPFEGIRDIRVARIQAEVRELALYQGIVLELKQNMQSMFGYSLPIGLARVRDKAYAPLAWRDMAKKCKLVGGLDSELGRTVLAGLPESKREALLEIERKRIHLNYVVGLVQYELTRLKRLEQEFDTWRRLMRETNQQRD